MSNEKRPLITFDEAMEQISDVARNGEGPDKFRALKVVLAQQGSNVTLPNPLSLEEVIERLARLMRGVGPTNCQWAYRKAFPASKKDIEEAMPRVSTFEMGSIEKDDLPKSLKQLYRRFPETKRPGYPPSYPAQGGMEAQVAWCQRKALEILKARELVKLNTLSTEASTNLADKPSAQ
jgi:hypothetical protein